MFALKTQKCQARTPIVALRRVTPLYALNVVYVFLKHCYLPVTASQGARCHDRCAGKSDSNQPRENAGLLEVSTSVRWLRIDSGDAS